MYALESCKPQNHTVVSDKATYNAYTWEWPAVCLSQHRFTGPFLFSNACAFYRIFLRATEMVCFGIYCTFEVGSDAGIISWRSSHELVQEVRRRQLWSCPAGGLYLLLTGAQSDITQGGEGMREGTNTKRKHLRNSRGGVFVHMRGSSGGGGKKNQTPTEWEADSSSASQSSAKNAQRWMEKWGWKMTIEWLASAGKYQFIYFTSCQRLIVIVMH